MMDTTRRPIQISVALVTRNRPDSLDRTLKSLRAQSVQPWEVLISDDSSAEHCVTVELLAAQYDCRYIRGPQRGLYANRNHVALSCRGTHIRTMDDDHEFPAAHFERCATVLAQDPGAIWIIGEYLPAEERPDVTPLCPGQLHPRGFSTLPPDPDRSWAISDGGTIYPRTLFDRGLRFAEEFKFGASYLEFGSRLYWLGYRIRLVRGTYLIHHYVSGMRSFSSEEMEQSSRFCAMMCHSFHYQPTIRNRALTGLEVMKQIITRPAVTWRSLPAGIAGYRRQRSWLNQQDLRRLRPVPTGDVTCVDAPTTTPDE